MVKYRPNTKETVKPWKLNR